MADRWIVTNYHYAQSTSLKDAVDRCDKLQAKCPKQKFRILRIKTNLTQSNAYDELVGWLKKVIVREGCMDQNDEIKAIKSLIAKVEVK